jgi:UDP-glucose 4-epimerase
VRVAVTGGAGFVGVPLCRQLASRGHEVLVVDTLASGEGRRRLVEPHARLAVVDVTNQPALRRTFEEFAPDGVVHLAALHFIPDCNRRPVDATCTNVVGTQSVLTACRDLEGLSRVVVTSSAAVYPISDEFMTEATSPAPTDIYGITKAANERQAAEFTRETGVSTVAARLFNVIGVGETNPHVVPAILEQMQNGDVLQLGNVTAKRCYIDVEDVADAFVALLQVAAEGPAVFNVGRREEASVEEIVALAAEISGRPLQIAYDPARGRASDRPFLRCDPARLQAASGFVARRSLRDTLEGLLQGSAPAAS